MRLTAHAKVNWALSILSRQPDGYHTMDMLTQSVCLGDTIELHKADTISLTVGGEHPIPADGRNLAIKAAVALHETQQITCGAAIHIKKRIPVGAGMGGGSADAAAVLLGLNLLWDLKLSDRALHAIALGIGSDIPFCLTGGLARVGGIGDQITPLPCNETFHLLIIQPCGGLSTPAVFAAYDALPKRPQNPSIDDTVRALSAGGPARLAGAMGNALEAAAIPQKPEIAICAQTMEHYGALRAQMTGSGSAVIGLFETGDEAANAYRACCRIWRRCYQTRTTNYGVTLISDIK